LKRERSGGEIGGFEHWANFGVPQVYTVTKTSEGGIALPRLNFSREEDPVGVPLAQVVSPRIADAIVSLHQIHDLSYDSDIYLPISTDLAEKIYSARFADAAEWRAEARQLNQRSPGTAPNGTAW